MVGDDWLGRTKGLWEDKGQSKVCSRNHPINEEMLRRGDQARNYVHCENGSRLDAATETLQKARKITA